MTRIVKEYDERFNEIMDTAQALFLSKGYELTSVQDIINQIGVAKGTFYHYFESKADLLEAVVKRSRERIMGFVTPIVDDPARDALAKFEDFFRIVSNWKLVNHDMVLRAVRMLFKDENVLLRLKLTEETRQQVGPVLAAIIEQGVEEGLFHVTFPLETAELILRLCEVPSYRWIAALLNGSYDDQSVEVIKRELQVFNRSIERVLGMVENTFDLVKDEDLSDWLSLLEKRAAGI